MIDLGGPKAESLKALRPSLCKPRSSIRTGTGFAHRARTLVQRAPHPSCGRRAVPDPSAIADDGLNVGEQGVAGLAAVKQRHRMAAARAPFDNRRSDKTGAAK